MTRRALSRRVISWLGNVWPDLACAGGRRTPIFPSTWDSILNISKNLPYQINWSWCATYTLRCCASAGFKENQIELSDFEKFNDYSRSWGEKIWWNFDFLKYHIWMSLWVRGVSGIIVVSPQRLCWLKRLTRRALSRRVIMLAGACLASSGLARRALDTNFSFNLG